MATLAKLAVELSLNDQMSSKLAGAGAGIAAFGAKAQAVGRTMTMGLTLPLVAAGVAAVKWASDLNEAMSAANTVFGNNATQIQNWSKTTALAMGIARSDALTAATQFASLGKNAGMANDQLVPFSTNLVQAAADLSSFWNTPTSTVLADLYSGLVGQYEPLRKYGIALSEASVQQKALEMTGKASADQLTEGEKVAARYELIMRSMGPATGDFSRTQAGLANQMRIAQAQFKDAAAALGMQLLPAMTQLVTKLNELILGFQGLSPRQQKAIESFVLFAAILGPIALAIGFVATHITALGAAFGAIMAPITAVIAVLAGPFILLFAPIIAGIVLIKKNLFGLGDAFNAVRGIVGSASSAISSTVRSMASGVSSTFASLRSTTSAVWQAMKTDATGAASGMASGVLAIIEGMASDTYNAAFNAGYGIGNGIIAGIAAIWDSVIGYVDSLVSTVIDKLGNIPGFSPIEHVGQYYGEKLGMGFADGIASATGMSGRAASGLVGAATGGISHSYGGISINVNGAGDPRATADAVFAVFAREISLREGV